MLGVQTYGFDPWAVVLGYTHGSKMLTSNLNSDMKGF